MTICDLDFIKSITPGSYTFPINVIEAFLRETPSKIDELKRVISEEKWDLIYELAHKIKPGILMLGIPHENSDGLLKILKYTKEQHKLNEIQDLYQVFNKNMDLIYKDLEEALKILKTG